MMYKFTQEHTDDARRSDKRGLTYVTMAPQQSSCITESIVSSAKAAWASLAGDRHQAGVGSGNQNLVQRFRRRPRPDGAIP